MRHKRKPGVASAGRKRNAFDTGKNKADLQNKQSPWSAAPVDNPEAGILERLKQDRDLLMDIVQGDEAFFDANLSRTFLVRSTSPHERRCGGGDGWMLIVKVRGRKYAHFPIPEIGHLDASKHNSDEVGRYLFSCLTHDLTAANTDPFLFGVIEEIRGARHG